MVVDANYMEQTFARCNKAYFNGSLPLPQFVVTNSKKECAYFHYDDWGSGLTAPVIYMSAYYDFPVKTIVDLMCHEMVHYCLALTGKDRRCRHGREFMKMAYRLNASYNLHITKTVDVSAIPKRRGTAALPKDNKKSSNMRFYKEYNGFLWEFNSLGEFAKFLIGRVVGAIISLVIIFGIMLFFYWYGQTH